MHRLNIIQASAKSRSKSVTNDGSGQGASWWMALVIGKQSLTHRLNTVDADDDDNGKDALR